MTHVASSRLCDGPACKVTNRYGGDQSPSTRGPPGLFAEIRSAQRGEFRWARRHCRIVKAIVHATRESRSRECVHGSWEPVPDRGIGALGDFHNRAPAQIGVATLDRNSRVLDIIEFIDITGPLVHVEERLACTYRERQAMAPHTGSTGN